MNEIKSGYFWLNDLLKNKDKILKDNNFYLKTGILNLDKYVKGLVEQQFYVLAARPSVGKTTFCLNLIVRSLRNLKNNEIIVFFSLEMSSKEILNRLLKILAFLW
ncbi:repb, partial [Metamycoplasma alkalescens]